MSEPAWKLSAYFPERLRSNGDGASRPGLLADRILTLCDHHDVATSIMLRGIASFGPIGVLRTDESLSLSEDSPAVVYAVDTESTITDLVEQVSALTSRGLITLERAQLASAPTSDGESRLAESDAVKLSVYVGRLERVGKTPAYRAVCDILRRHDFDSAAAFLGVDGTAHGKRYRAKFFSRNVNVPTMVVSVGSARNVAHAVADLQAAISHPLLTIERVQLCKRHGTRNSPPRALPEFDEHGQPRWQKLMVHTTEGMLHQGIPIHREIVRRLLHDKVAQGATALRGIWGFQGDIRPHGDRVLQLVRKVPVTTIIVDTPAAIANSFELIDQLTARQGVVTCETVPAALSIHAPATRGHLRPARYLP